MSYSKHLDLKKLIIETHYGHLNPMQIKAVLSVEGPLLVLAGAGSGKTSVIVNRIAHILKFGSSFQEQSQQIKISPEDSEQIVLFVNDRLNHKFDFARLFQEKGIPANRILALTFTNKAAREMKERLQNLIDANVSQMWICTFHSACVKILRRNIDKIGYSTNFVIYDDSDQDFLLKECLKELALDEKMFSYKEAKFRISKLKDRLVKPSEHLKNSIGNFREEKFAYVYKLYEDKLKKNNALDFDNIIIKTLELLETNSEIAEYYADRFKYILVDEYQDTNYPQYRLLKILAAKHNNICVVGDDDQSIYGWRGADIRNILEFEKDFGSRNIIKLEQNYRSSQSILNAANSVIKNNTGRKQKSLWTENPIGDGIVYHCANTEHYEAEFVCRTIRELMNKEDNLSNYAILYRTNAQSRVIEETMLRYGMRYKIYGGLRFYSRKEIKDIIAYLRVCENPNDDVSLKRIINIPKRGIGSATIAVLEKSAAEMELSIYSILTNDFLNGKLSNSI